MTPCSLLRQRRFVKASHAPRRSASKTEELGCPWQFRVQVKIQTEGEHQIEVLAEVALASETVASGPLDPVLQRFADALRTQDFAPAGEVLVDMGKSTVLEGLLTGTCQYQHLFFPEFQHQVSFGATIGQKCRRRSAEPPEAPRASNCASTSIGCPLPVRAASSRFWI